jgi:hypothetical protein
MVNTVGNVWDGDGIIGVGGMECEKIRAASRAPPFLPWLLINIMKYNSIAMLQSRAQKSSPKNIHQKSRL